MTGARTLRHRYCRHHRAPGHRSRRTIAVVRASEHMPRERGVDLAVVSTAGYFAAVEVDKG
jgi:HD superfamily phosphodiesterase